MDKKNIILIFLIAFLLILSIFLLQWRAANVVLQSSGDSYHIGEDISGRLSIRIDNNDFLEARTPILVALIAQNNSVLTTRTLSLEEFIEEGDNRIAKIESDGKQYYETPGTYSVEVERIIPYRFSEKGEYLLLFNVFDMDLTEQREITVS